jgi:hypothetical protein
MGVEAFVIPWLFAMTLVAIGGLGSLARLLGIIRYRSRAVPSADRNSAFWTRQIIKIAIVAFAFWQIFLILQRGL